MTVGGNPGGGRCDLLRMVACVCCHVEEAVMYQGHDAEASF